MESELETQINQLASEIIPVQDQEEGAHVDALFKVIIIGDTGK